MSSENMCVGCFQGAGALGTAPGGVAACPAVCPPSQMENGLISVEVMLWDRAPKTSRVSGKGLPGDIGAPGVGLAMPCTCCPTRSSPAWPVCPGRALEVELLEGPCPQGPWHMSSLRWVPCSPRIGHRGWRSPAARQLSGPWFPFAASLHTLKL